MSQKIRKRTAIILLCLMLFPLFSWIRVAKAEELSQSATAYVLIEAQTGQIIEAKNETEPLHGAGITKIMSFLLFFEALENGIVKMEDSVSVSAEAASKSGTSAFLDSGESHTFGDLLKAAIVGSANDATCALAEKIAGSESAFTEQMNQKAELLGIDAVFADCTGISTDSKASAQAFAVIASRLAKYSPFFEYSSCWTYPFVHNNGRETEITNSNTLVRDGTCDGMATGSTSEGGYHMIASAKSGGARFIFVILGEQNAANRSSCANKAISQAVATYGVKQIAQKDAKYKSVSVKGAENEEVDVYPSEDLSILYQKGEENDIQIQVEMDELILPLTQGQIVGKIIVNTPAGRQSVALEIRQDIDSKSIKGSAGKILRIWLFGLS